MYPDGQTKPLIPRIELVEERERSNSVLVPVARYDELIRAEVELAVIEAAIKESEVYQISSADAMIVMRIVCATRAKFVHELTAPEPEDQEVAPNA